VCEFADARRGVDPERVSVYRSTAESVYILAAPGLQDRSPQSLSRRVRERTDLLQRDFPTTMYTYMYLYSLGVCILISLPHVHIHTTGSLGVPPRLINDAQMMKMNRFCSEPLCSSLCFIYPRCCYYCALAFLCCECAKAALLSQLYIQVVLRAV
jgi:hypothetical protein